MTFPVAPLVLARLVQGERAPAFPQAWGVKLPVNPPVRADAGGCTRERCRSRPLCVGGNGIALACRCVSTQGHHPLSPGGSLPPALPPRLGRGDGGILPQPTRTRVSESRGERGE